MRVEDLKVTESVEGLKAAGMKDEAKATDSAAVPKAAATQEELTAEAQDSRNPAIGKAEGLTAARMAAEATGCRKAEGAKADLQMAEEGMVAEEAAGLPPLLICPFPPRNPAAVTPTVMILTGSTAKRITAAI